MQNSTVAVLIDTKGRPGFVADVVNRVLAQTRAPDHVFVVGAHPLDLAALDQDDARLTCLVSRKPRAGRFNDALDMAGAAYDHLIFFDDDYLPSRFWIERAMQIFAASPEFVALAGDNIVRNTDSHGVSLSDALSIIRWSDGFTSGPLAVAASFISRLGNLAVRSDVLENVRLDETLPFGSRLSDVDFCNKIAQRGRIGRSEQLNGVKIDVSAQRENGRRTGFAQIANAVYLARKGSLPRGLTLKLMAKSFAANALRSVAPESHIDRRGRLLGNLQAFATLLQGAQFATAHSVPTEGGPLAHS